MQRPHLHRDFVFWCLILAVLAAALAPSLSRALAARDAAPRLDICTARGADTVAAGTAPADAPAPASKHSFEHCPYCSLHSQLDGAPPAPSAALPAPQAGHDAPPAFFFAPRRLHTWVSAQPRAPPVHS